MGIPTITRKLEFDAGHRLIHHAGKCANYHGHRYVIELTLSAQTIDSKTGMFVDFGEVKAIMQKWLDDNWDHGMILEHGDPWLNMLSLEAFKGQKVYVLDRPPTVENLVRHFANVAQSMLKLRVDHVRMYETPNCWADYKPVYP